MSPEDKHKARRINFVYKLVLAALVLLWAIYPPNRSQPSQPPAVAATLEMTRQ